jgi:hypothetical protein
MRNPVLPVLLLLGVGGLFLGPVARADEVILQGGTRLEGSVLVHDEDGVTLLLDGDTQIRLASADVREVVRDADTSYLRFHERDDGSASLQTPIVHLVHPESGLRVDLVGAVHVADASYYRAIQRWLDQSDHVLFEGVLPKGETVEEMMKSREESTLTRMQRGLAKWLDLAYQLDGIDYARTHFVNADLTMESMASASDESVEDLLGRVSGSAFLWRMLEPVLGLLKKAESLPGLRGTHARIKRTLAEALATAAAEPRRMIGADLYDLLIVKRNAVVVERLRTRPESARSVAVFYGAAHLADLEEQLVEAFGLVRAGSRWLDAWSFPAPR